MFRLFVITLCFVLYERCIFVSGDDCTLITPNPKENELLKRLEPLKGKTFTTKSKGENEEKVYDYKLGICTNAISDTKYPNVGLFQTDGAKNHTVGLYNQTKLMGSENWIFITYKGGDNYSTRHCNGSQREAVIMIICDHEHELGELKAIEENTDKNEECYYLFELSASFVCAKPPKEPLSGGSIFCIIFFTFVSIYLVFGFLYQRIVVGAKGYEQIPNYTFWKEFGRLQADGCDFMCRCGERQEAKEYHGIDDQLLNPEPRDDRDERLLPM